MAEPPREGEGERLRQLFELHLDEIERVISWIARRFAMGADDTEEFRSRVHLRLVEDEYRVLREFGGRSSFRTYMVSVVQNLARDYRMSRWGRWRPSAAAERLGLVAVQLECLLERDGFTLDEAIEMLRANHGVKMSRLELVDLAARLPRRTRPRLESVETAATVAADGRADAGVRQSEGEVILSHAQQALAEALRELEVEDRLILKMHYQSGLTIAAIAAALDLDQRGLYTRRDRCRRRLKQGLTARGVEVGAVLDALGWSGADFTLNYGLDGAELDETDPSNNPRRGAPKA